MTSAKVTVLNFESGTNGEIIKKLKLSFGFGVRPNTLDPTIIKIACPYSGHSPWFVNVYTLSKNSWYPVDNHRLPRETVRIRKRSGQAVVDRFIYWVGFEKHQGDDGIFIKTYVILSFDMITHQFQVVDIPQVLRDVLSSPFHISKLRSSLVLSGTFSVGDIVLLCEWVLTVDGASVTSFNIVFSLPTNHSVKLIGSTNTDEPIVEVDELGYQLVHTLKVYDPVAEEFCGVGMEADSGSFYIGPYKESLILLNRPDRSLDSLNL
ncbi:hypothetical protein Tco_1012022 [Tanacetum coccineum]